MSKYNFNNQEDFLVKQAEAEIERRKKGGQYFTFQTIREGVNKDRNSKLSNSALISLRFNATNYLDENGDVETTEEFDLELASCTIKRKKNVVITPILNEKGSIKQLTGTDDYDITISGLLVGNLSSLTDDQFNTEYSKPIEQLTTLQDILETDISLSITSQFLNELGIYNLVITDYDIPQDFNSKNVQNFRIRAVSDNENIRAI